MDPAIAAKAPNKITASGYGDLIAKIPSGADWIIADGVGCESIDKFAFSLIQKNLSEALTDPDAIASGDVTAVGKLAYELIMSGFACSQCCRAVRRQVQNISSATIGIWKACAIMADMCLMVSVSQSVLLCRLHVLNSF